MFTIPVAAISDDPILADPETILEVAMMIDCVAGGVKVTVLDSTSRETWSLELLELKGPPLILRQISELLSQVMDAFKEPTLKRSMLPISEAALETFTQMIVRSDLRILFSLFLITDLFLDSRPKLHLRNILYNGMKILEMESVVR